jgi:hypothetical protein
VTLDNNLIILRVTMVAPIIGAGDGYTDLLGLDAEFEFVSPERKALMDAAEDAQHGGVAVEPMEIDMQRDALTARQDAHHELTRSTLDFYNPSSATHQGAPIST